MKSSVEFECKLDLRWSQIYSFVRWLLLDPRPDLAGIDFTTSISISSPAASFFAIHSSLSQCDVLYKNVLVCLLCPRFQKWDRCLSLKCLLDIPTTAAKMGFHSALGWIWFLPFSCLFLGLSGHATTYSQDHAEVKTVCLICPKVQYRVI